MRHKHTKPRSRFMRAVRGLTAMLLVIAVLLGCWSIAYFVTRYFYQALGNQPQAFAIQLINSVLGFFIFGIIMFIVGRLMAPKRMDFLTMMNDAMKRIAKGDFNVKLTVGSSDNPFDKVMQNLNHMAEELGQMEQLRQEFISNVSHEIQSPLTSIAGFARALQNDTLGQDDRHHYLNIIETESKRLSKLSDNLLKLTSLESKHHPFEPKPYRLDKQLRSIVLACEPQWLNKSIEMEVSLIEISVTADEDLMNQVWINLIHNSIKFTPVGGTIGINLWQDGDHALVSISDNGMGIPEEEQPHIFERFYKADKSRNRSDYAGGSGLGLSIVKKIVDMHGGDIRLISTPGISTSFTISLALH
jgi:two-component system phosphate regulon sensor histidine kinase PhoR